MIAYLTIILSMLFLSASFLLSFDALTHASIHRYVHLWVQLSLTTC